MHDLTINYGLLIFFSNTRSFWIEFYMHENLTDLNLFQVCLEEAGVGKTL